MFQFIPNNETNTDHCKFQVLRTVDHLLPDQIKLQSFVVDFEAALWRALQDRFPGYTIQGCVFHWTQAVYRKVQEFGLQVIKSHCIKLLKLLFAYVERKKPQYL